MILMNYLLDTLGTTCYLGNMTKPKFVKLVEDLLEARAYSQEFPLVRPDGRKSVMEYQVPQGLDCLVCHSQDQDRRWRPHTTTRKSYARRVVGPDGEVILKSQDWLLKTIEPNVQRTDWIDEVGL